MWWVWALGALAAIIAIAACVEAFVKRNRPKRPLVDTQPTMPHARYNLGAGFEKEWRPKLPKDTEKGTSK
ncbi:hypothetical protein KO498_11625 [Lentibacter algarum]|uniref:hypothetical protein n=1 Tax=Lentibacter algarum TaxID=576131 RepID=UPI001C0827F1|nr:hypothetical protein [Lentibacter algarum]MBU2982459.1 hypothetical protein [Lentibacter algarum]